MSRLTRVGMAPALAMPVWVSGSSTSLLSRMAATSSVWLTASSLAGFSMLANAATAPAAAASALQCGMSTTMINTWAALVTASTLLDLQSGNDSSAGTSGACKAVLHPHGCLSHTSAA